MIHSTCEDYRASATVDMNDDAFSRDKKISMPLLVLWGEKGFINKNYNVIDVWKDYAKDVSGKALECGHFLAEEAPFDVIDEFRKFFR
jgi:haloacetate dehalogenase